MTKKNRWRARRANDDEIPPHVVRFFEHGGSIPWELLMWDYADRAKVWWQKWSRENPTIDPPELAFIELHFGPRAIPEAQNRDGPRAQSAERKTDAGNDAVSLTKKDAEK